MAQALLPVTKAAAFHSFDTGRSACATAHAVQDRPCTRDRKRLFSDLVPLRRGKYAHLRAVAVCDFVTHRRRRLSAATFVNRILAFFDLLGFKKFVLSKPLEDAVASLNGVYYSVLSASTRHDVSQSFSVEHLESVLATYSTLPVGDLTKIRSRFEQSTGFKFLLMSDSIVLYSALFDPKTDTHKLRHGFSTAIRLSRIVMVNLFERMLRARGGIALGEFHADVENSIYCGKALVEAHDMAESQDWIGAVLCPSLEEVAKSYEEGFTVREYTQQPSLARPGWDFVRYDAPFKSGVRPAWVINWGSAFNFGGPVRSDFFGDVLTGIEREDRKYENTLLFLQWLHQRQGHIIKTVPG